MCKSDISTNKQTYFKSIYACLFIDLFMTQSAQLVMHICGFYNTDKTFIYILKAESLMTNLEVTSSKITFPAIFHHVTSRGQMKYVKARKICPLTEPVSRQLV